ncbi:MAG: hypothetical protein ACRDZ9_02465 [Acidimicrobiales bacterium]
MDAVVLALQSEHETFWVITLGLGVVVAIAVVVLLSLLVAFVRDIDRNVLEAWETATRVARNTATTWMLQQTSVFSGSLRDEVRRHDELLSAAEASGGGR